MQLGLALLVVPLIVAATLLLLGAMGLVVREGRRLDTWARAAADRLESDPEELKFWLVDVRGELAKRDRAVVVARDRLTTLEPVLDSAHARLRKRRLRLQRVRGRALPLAAWASHLVRVARIARWMRSWQPG